MLGLLEAVDPLLGGRERDAVAGLAGLDRQRDRQVGLAGAGRPEEADVAVLGDPGELGEVQDQRLLGAGLRGEVEVLERLVGREGGVADALAGAGGVAREDLGLQQRLEELLVGPALLAGPRGGLLQALQHARRLELGEQVGQPLADRRGLGLRSCAQLGVVGQRRRHDLRGGDRDHRGDGRRLGAHPRRRLPASRRRSCARSAATVWPRCSIQTSVAVPAQLDALMDQRLRRAVEAAGVLEIAVERHARRRGARPRRTRPAAAPAACSRSCARRSATTCRPVACRRGSATRSRQSA